MTEPKSVPLPKSETRRRIAELAAEGLNAKEIAAKIERNYDNVRKLLKQPDVQVYLLHLQTQIASPDEAQRAIQVIDRIGNIKEWRALAGHVQQFYTYILERALTEPEVLEQVVGYDPEGKPRSITVINPLAKHFHTLAEKIAARVEDRAWGKVPQKIDVEALPTSDRLEDLKDHQLAYYRRLILMSWDRNLALAEAKRLKAPDQAERFEDFERDAENIVEAEILAIEGEVESDT